MKNRRVTNRVAENQPNFPKFLKIGLFGYITVGIFTGFIQIIRGGNVGEGFDKTIYLSALVIAVITIVAGVKSRKNSHSGSTFTLISILLLIIVGIGGVEKHGSINGVNLSDRLWLGFGPFVLALGLVLAPFIYRIYEWKSLKIYWKIVIASSALASTLLAFPSFWQSASTVIDADHSEYVLNEIIAPVVGHWPYVDYIPQYQTFYGFLLLPFSGGKSAAELSNLALISLTILCYLTIAIGIYLAWIALNRRSIWIATLIVVPFTCLTQFPHRVGYLGSIAALLSGLSIRILPGLLLIGLTLWVLARKPKIEKSFSLPFLIVGIAAGLVAWQSQDFGIAAVAAILSMVLFGGSLTKALNWRKSIIVLLGVLIGLGIYPIVGIVNGRHINLNYFMFFDRQFGSGFGAEGIKTPGPVLFILPLLIFLVVSHFMVLTQVRKSSNFNLAAWRSAVLGGGMAVWSLLGFTYYLNRSYASGQMQVLFLPISISLAALIGHIYNEELNPSWSVLGDSSKFKNLLNLKNSTSRWSLGLALIITIPVASVLLSPNPAIELNRISTGNKVARWPKPSVLQSIADANGAKIYAAKNHLTLGFFGASSQYVQKETGVRSMDLLNSPLDLYMSKNTVVVSCEYLFKINPDSLIVSDEGASLFRFQGNTLCNRYSLTTVPGVRQSHFAIKK